MTDPLQRLWTAGDDDAPPPARADLHRRARRLARRAWLRDASEYAAALAVIAIFTLYWRTAANEVIAAGCALTIAGTLLVVAGLWRRRARAAPDASAVGVDFLRAQLMQQRDMLADVARWYLAPVVPGMLVFLAGKWWQLADAAPGRATPMALATLTVMALVFLGISALNRRAARQLDARITDLDRLTIRD